MSPRPRHHPAQPVGAGALHCHTPSVQSDMGEVHVVYECRKCWARGPSEAEVDHSPSCTDVTCRRLEFPILTEASPPMFTQPKSPG